MTRQTVYVVVHRDMRYNDNWYDWSGAERPIRAFRDRERAEALARELALETDPNEPFREKWPGWDQAAPNHVVMEVEVDLPEEP